MASLTGLAPLRRMQIDWAQMLRARAEVVRHSNVPFYLLKPEIDVLLDRAKNANVHLMLNTLWHTGGRISEVLGMTKADFVLRPENPYLSLPPVKLRGRPPKNAWGDITARLIPLDDAGFVDTAQRYFSSTALRLRERVFNITRNSAYKRLVALIAALPVKQRRVYARTNLKTFRHSFAVNAVLHGVPLVIIQKWLGHQSLATTEIYTQVLPQDTHHWMRMVEF